MFLSMGKTDSVKRVKISSQKFRLIVNCFATDITSTACGEIVNVNRKTADRFYNYFRSLIINHQLLLRREFLSDDETEIDESYFGPSRVRGKRGRGAGHKIAVVGLLRRQGKVFTKPVDACTKEELMPVILAKVASGVDIYTDGWKSYDALAVYGFNHKKVKHHENEFSTGDGNHINGIESFWSFAKRRLAKFNGVKKRNFKERLLETEWRFNHRDKIKSTLKKLINRDRNYLS
jgi:transposase-like protein